MTIRPFSQIIWVLFAILILWLICTTVISIKYFYLTLKIGNATDSCHVFLWAVQDEHNYTTLSELVSTLHSVDIYYRPPSRFISENDNISPIIECSREITIRFLIHELERRTGECYGLDIDAWVQKYGSDDLRERRNCNKVRCPCPEVLESDQKTKTGSEN
jgi:hypothetical protein